MATHPLSASRLVTVGLLLGAAAALSALPQGKRPAKAPPLTPFEGTYDEARARAVDRNVPLVAISIVEENGKELDDDIREFRAALFAKPELAVAGQHAVVLLASNGPHAPATIEFGEGTEKTQRQVCSVYRTASCQVHQKLFDSLYAEHNVEGEFKSPSVIVLGVDRKVAKAWADGHTPAWNDVIAALGAVRKAAGEGLTEEQFVAVQGLLPQAREAQKAGDWGPAHLAWGKVLAITQATKYADEARAGQKKSVEELEKLRVSLRTELDGERALESYKKLLELQRGWAGTSYEKDLARDIAAAEKHKTAKDAIAAYKRELEAEQLWSDALELLGENKTAPAHAKLRTLLRKYAGSPAEQRVRARFAAFAAEEDAKLASGG
jgi:hypothetical protein